MEINVRPVGGKYAEATFIGDNAEIYTGLMNARERTLLVNVLQNAIEELESIRLLPEVPG